MMNGNFKVTNLRIIFAKNTITILFIQSPRGQETVTRESFGFGLWSGRNFFFLKPSTRFDVTVVDQMTSSLNSAKHCGS